MLVLDDLKLHPAFHVNLLRNPPPPGGINEDGQPKVGLKAVLIKRNNLVVTQWLVEWSNLGLDATWDDFFRFNLWGEEGNVMKKTTGKGNMINFYGRAQVEETSGVSHEDEV
ncbi:hypothetical protein GOBAR_DD07739 [Gossypium barbadense]|nr:hypothetical protein GOBAR_DD07739 [Gossypium barbadense]